MRKQITVTLSEAELWLGRKVAEYWHNEAIAKGRVEVANTELDQRKTALQRDIEGATGEIAVAKGLGLYYPALGSLRDGPDLGSKDRGDLYTLSGSPIQVRATRYPWGRLYVRPEDSSKKRQPFILVTARDRDNIRSWVLRGWVIGEDVMTSDFWVAVPKNKRPPYWEVKQHELLPIEALNRG